MRIEAVRLGAGGNYYYITEYSVLGLILCLTVISVSLTLQQTILLLPRRYLAPVSTPGLSTNPCHAPSIAPNTHHINTQPPYIQSTSTLQREKKKKEKKEKGSTNSSSFLLSRRLKPSTGVLFRPVLYRSIVCHGDYTATPVSIRNTFPVGCLLA